MCTVHALSPAFAERLGQLGEWVDVSRRRRLPLFSLDAAKGWKQYSGTGGAGT